MLLCLHGCDLRRKTRAALEKWAFCSDAWSPRLRRGVVAVRRGSLAHSASYASVPLLSLADRYKGRILPVDEPVARLWGRLNVPDPLPAVDGLLAATALINDLTLVTRNTRDVARTGARLLNPFDRRG